MPIQQVLAVVQHQQQAIPRKGQSRGPGRPLRCSADRRPGRVWVCPALGNATLAWGRGDLDASMFVRNAAPPPPVQESQP